MPLNELKKSVNSLTAESSYKRLVCLILLSFSLPLISYSQEIIGFWEGELYFSDSLFSNCFYFQIGNQSGHMGSSTRQGKYNIFRIYGYGDGQGDIEHDSIVFQEFNLEGPKTYYSRKYLGKIGVDVNLNKYVIEGTWIAQSFYTNETRMFTYLNSPWPKGWFKLAKDMPLPQQKSGLPYLRMEIDGFIKPDMYRQLEEVAFLQKNNPTVAIQIEAHSANKLDNWSNILESQFWANRIRSFIFSKTGKINSRRVNPIGFGDLFMAQPLEATSKIAVIISFWNKEQ